MKFNFKTRYGQMKSEHPERMAWIVLSTAFGMFCLLSILIPFLIYWYIVNTTIPFSTEVTSVRGTVLLGEPEAEGFRGRPLLPRIGKGDGAVRARGVDLRGLRPRAGRALARGCGVAAGGPQSE